MPTLLERAGTRLAKSRLGGALLGEVYRSVDESMRVMQKAYYQGPWQLPPEVLREQLREVDPWQVHSILNTDTWDIIGGYTGDSNAERQRAVRESERLYKYNPLAQWTVWLWTSWGLGDKVKVAVPANEEANEAIQDFFTSERNVVVLADDRIKELSRWLLVKGNRFFVFYTSNQDGETKIRQLDQAEMTPIANPEDKTDTWYYKREWIPGGGTQLTLYYPDWTTLYARNPVNGEYDDGVADKRWQILVEAGAVPANGRRADRLNGDADDTVLGEEATTVACILWATHNQKDEADLWGWPLLTNPRAWLQAHHELMEDRLTVSRAKSQFVRRKKFTGGSRVRDGLINTVASTLGRSQWTDTNPSATAGSVEFDNSMVDTTDIAMTTGAGDTATDNKTFAWMALLGGGLFPTSAGLDTARFATALEMDKAQSMLFETYRQFWSAQFRKIGNIALMALEKYGGQNFGEYTITVSIDTFSISDFPAIAKTIGQFARDTIIPLVEKGTLSNNAALAIMGQLYKISLHALGIESTDELTSDEALGIGQPAPAESDTMAQIAAVIRANVEEGSVDWQAVSEWALDSLVEGVE